MKPTKLSNLDIRELSLVLRHDEEGVEYEPRNGDARFLGLKGKAKPKLSLQDEIIAAFQKSRAAKANASTSGPADLATPQIANVISEYRDLAQRMDALTGQLAHLGITAPTGEIAGRTGPVLDDGPTSSRGAEDLPRNATMEDKVVAEMRNQRRLVARLTRP